MAIIPAPSRHSEGHASAPHITAPTQSRQHTKTQRAASALSALAAFALVGLVLIAAPALRAQTASPHIASITPNSGKSDDTITITGQNLDKSNVAAVFLSDDKLDHKAVVVDQEATKIVIKVPDGLKAGDYNVSIQEGGAIYIQPVIFTVKP